MDDHRQVWLQPARFTTRTGVAPPRGRLGLDVDLGDVADAFEIERAEVDVGDREAMLEEAQ